MGTLAREGAAEERSKMTIDPLAFSQTQIALAMMRKDAAPREAAAAPKSHGWLSALVTFAFSTLAGIIAGITIWALGYGLLGIMIAGGASTVAMSAWLDYRRDGT